MPTTSLRELPEFLAAKGLRPRHIARIAASLEDVFVQLIAADCRDAEGGRMRIRRLKAIARQGTAADLARSPQPDDRAA